MTLLEIQNGTTNDPDSAEVPTGIPVRRPAVDLANADIERWTVPGDPIFSHFLSALSAAFPNGEDFFVQSVRAYRHVIADDPELKAKVKGFIGQEAMHGREHRAFNERLAEVGYPTARQDAALLRIAKRLHRLPPRFQLSITAASEHFTSVLANAILRDEQTRQTLFPGEDIHVLITWHALEELEHKDVAFDLLDEVDGRYLVRISGLGLAAVGFGVVVVSGFVRALWDDRDHIGRKELRRYVHHRRRQRMIGLRTLVEVMEYLRPGFHPRDVATDDMVIEWRRRLEGSMVTGSGKHAGAASS